MSHSEQIITAARGWVGTRFAHQGRLKKTATHRGGVDCLGLLVGVANELGLPLAQHDDVTYGHLPDERALYKKLSELLLPVDTLLMEAGDIVLLRVDGRAQHMGIVSAYGKSDFGLIHAYAPARAVVEHRLDEEWMQKVVGVFRVKG